MPVFEKCFVTLLDLPALCGLLLSSCQLLLLTWTVYSHLGLSTFLQPVLQR